MIDTVYIDFDGTLIDCRKRLYGLFRSLNADLPFDENKYWQLKAEGQTQRKLLEDYLFKTEEEINEFVVSWLEGIEKEEWLVLDEKRDFSDDFLNIIKQKYRIKLITNRQSKKNLNLQIKELGWKGFFDEVLVTEQKHTKKELIERDSEHQCGLLIGDTSEDILTAKSLGMQSIAIYSGIESWQSVLECSPTFMAMNLREVWDIVNSEF